MNTKPGCSYSIVVSGKIENQQYVFETLWQHGLFSAMPADKGIRAQRGNHNASNQLIEDPEDIVNYQSPNRKKKYVKSQPTLFLKADSFPTRFST